MSELGKSYPSFGEAAGAAMAGNAARSAAVPPRPAAPDEYAGHVGSCRIFYAEHRCTCAAPDATAAPDTSCGCDADLVLPHPAHLPWPTREAPTEPVPDLERATDAASHVAPDAAAGDGLRWRVGEHYGIHVYEGDRPVATFHREEDARRCVDVLAAAARDAELRKECCDRVYLCNGEVECPVHGGFDVCCDRPDLHRAVVTDVGARVGFAVCAWHAADARRRYGKCAECAALDGTT